LNVNVRLAKHQGCPHLSSLARQRARTYHRFGSESMSTSGTKERPTEEEQRQLDRVFGALSDPARRSILERLQTGPLLVSELAAPFEISLQAVSRHIQVLEEAGLIQKERTGRISRCSLVAGPILDAAVWINRYSKYWQAQFELLAVSLESLEHGRLKPARATSARAEPARKAAPSAAKATPPRARRTPPTKRARRSKG
jgi:DNA-binding transcriptional ArsR family regulator